MSSFIKTDEPMTSPLPNTRRGTGTALYRSVFNYSDRPSIVGEITSVGPGLTAGTWEGTESALAISGLALVRGASVGTWSNGLVLANTGAAISVIVAKLPTAGDVYLDLFRQTFVGSPDVYRVIITSAGMGQLVIRTDGANRYAGAQFPVSPGNRVGVRWVGGVLEAVVNYSVVSSVINSEVLPRGYAAISGVSASAGFILDDVDVDTY